MMHKVECFCFELVERKEHVLSLKISGNTEATCAGGNSMQKDINKKSIAVKWNSQDQNCGSANGQGMEEPMIIVQ